MNPLWCMMQLGLSVYIGAVPATHGLGWFLSTGKGGGLKGRSRLVVHCLSGVGGSSLAWDAFRFVI